MADAFNSALIAPDASSEIPANSRLYGWLVGSWEGDIAEYDRDGSRRAGKAECHAVWVLEGRAIQDVWIAPPRTARTSSTPRTGNRYGTTLRVYDPKIDAWRITWINPVASAQLTQIGRPQGENIVQEGRNADGHLTRWTFSDMRHDSFRWTGEISTNAGTSWFLHLEFRFRRTSRN